MRVLVACEESQVVTVAFRRRGHEAYSCDVVECSGGHPEWHIQDDVMRHLEDGWDLMIAHPECRYLAKSGVRWFKESILRMHQAWLAAGFFNRLLGADIGGVCVENPIQHNVARQWIRKPDQVVQPWWFGHGESKATCFWLKGLSPLLATEVHSGRDQRLYRLGPSAGRGRERSRTYQGIADAMAEQWS